MNSSMTAEEMWDSFNSPWPRHIVAAMRQRQNIKMWNMAIRDGFLPDFKRLVKQRKLWVKQSKKNFEDVRNAQKMGCLTTVKTNEDGSQDPDAIPEDIDICINRRLTILITQTKALKYVKLHRNLFVYLYNRDKKKVDELMPLFKAALAQSLDYLMEKNHLCGMCWYNEDGTTSHQTEADQEGNILDVSNEFQIGCNRLENLRLIFF